ncbi:hypothetical protein KAJ83_08985 [Marivibrio halodurans]|uniref:DUF5666 domain-containing protein n=1 Tax=Marivibrio halodurans TaxID=2039722 RepID=A0A8J7S219_9PROT|nr:hypothetical protein [Marivibrio halodurans]MBP5857143.1 hypothetical protein [Marivibrio halodurans]
MFDRRSIPRSGRPIRHPLAAALGAATIAVAAIIPPAPTHAGDAPESVQSQGPAPDSTSPNDGTTEDLGTRIKRQVREALQQAGIDSSNDTAPDGGTVRIDGNATIDARSRSVTTTARNGPDGAPSTARTCVGSIGGGGGADVQITGKLVVKRSGTTNECECDSPGAACESQPAD